MAEWSWAVGGAAPGGVPERELTAAFGRTVTWRVDAASTAQFSIDGRHDEAAAFVERESDLWIWRDGVLLFRGRIVPPVQDDIDEDGHLCQVVAVDYRGMLAHRIVGADGRTFSAVDQAQIAWTLIDESQSLSGGDWGIVEGVGATSGTTRDRTYPAGKGLLDAIGELGRVDGGFEWQISPDLELDRWYPTRGSVVPVVLDWGGVLARVRRASAEGWANHVVSVGAQGTTPEEASTATIGTDAAGRWELFDGDGSTIEQQATLAARAVWARDQASGARATWSVEWAPGRWQGPDEIWIGDTATLAVQSGRLDVVAPHRLVTLTAVPGEDGDEKIVGGLL
jgi:hypothetical protein